jgi:hypothetical protein
MTKKEAFKKAFESQNVPPDLADQCANILIQDESRPRTQQEQETIDKAYEIAFGVHPRNIK